MIRAAEISHDAEPCIICGAPIVANEGHDAGCMAVPDFDARELDVGVARARVRAYAEAMRRHDARANEARCRLGRACFEGLRAGATSGELAIDAGFTRAYVDKLAREAWRAEPTEPLEENRDG